MIRWKLQSSPMASQTWNQHLVTFSEANIFQSYEWGEFRKAFGWEPYRWEAVDEEAHVVALFQGVFRKHAGVGFVFGDGGPVGNSECWGEPLQHQILQDLHLKRCLCRIYPRRPSTIEEVLLLRAQGWQRSLFPFSSGMSMVLDLSCDKEKVIDSFTTNWRHNWRRASKKNLKFERWEQPAVSEVFQIYTAMESYKEIPQQFSEEELKQLLVLLKNYLVLYRGVDESGAVIGVRGCVILGTYALDLFAATTDNGRKLYASYGLFWELLRECMERGVTSYDLNGIDPVGGQGVYNFKKGSGGTPVEYLGEWDWATSEELRLWMSVARQMNTSYRTKLRKLKTKFHAKRLLSE
ncbi:peptidoglycan bridge formation glycyltransferase FemA/FemB family protein [Deltaproteobacteria bacterium TL4]